MGAAKSQLLFKNVNRNAEFTPLEDRIGIVRIGRREMNLTSFFLEFM